MEVAGLTDGAGDQKVYGMVMGEGDEEGIEAGVGVPCDP